MSKQITLEMSQDDFDQIVNAIENVYDYETSRLLKESMKGEDAPVCVNSRSPSYLERLRDEAALAFSVSLFGDPNDMSSPEGNMQIAFKMADAFLRHRAENPVKEGV